MAEEAALPLRLLPCLRSSPPALMMMTTIITGKKKSPAVPISLTPAMLLLLLLLFSAVSGLAGFFFALEDFTVGTGRGDSLGSAKRPRAGAGRRGRRDSRVGDRTCGRPAPRPARHTLVLVGGGWTNICRVSVCGLARARQFFFSRRARRVPSSSS